MLKWGHIIKRKFFQFDWLRSKYICYLSIGRANKYVGQDLNLKFEIINLDFMEYRDASQIHLLKRSKIVDNRQRRTNFCRRDTPLCNPRLFMP